jgi:cation:H+ antiporter
VHSAITWIEHTGVWAPWIFTGIFLFASFLTIWCLECMSDDGMEGTVLGTLVTPYITGFGNLIFAFILGRKGAQATEVMTNCLVNNVTNMTLVLGLPAIFWNLNLFAGKKESSKKPNKSGKPDSGAMTREVNRLSLLLTLVAILFFTGTTWVIGSDGKIDFHDGIVLVALFLFWQCFHVFEVLKTNARNKRKFSWFFPVYLALLAVGAWAIYVSTDWLVNWVSARSKGFVSEQHLGWLSGWLMVLPNAMLAVYYAWTKRPEIVFTSQVGDNHICIPLCIGVFALFKTIVVPPFFATGVIILLAATFVHLFFVGIFGRLPWYVGLLLVAAYGWFLKVGVLN